MTFHYNKQSEKNNRRKLRKNSTEAERLLWEKLRGRKVIEDIESALENIKEEMQTS